MVDSAAWNEFCAFWLLPAIARSTVLEESPVMLSSVMMRSRTSPMKSVAPCWEEGSVFVRMVAVPGSGCVGDDETVAERDGLRHEHAAQGVIVGRGRGRGGVVLIRVHVACLVGEAELGRLGAQAQPQTYREDLRG